VLWLTSVGAVAINPALYDKLAYDPVKDLTPVSLVVNNVEMFVVPANAPYNTGAEFVAAARKTIQDKAARLTMASSGTGSVPHLAMELLNDAAKLNLVRVPYKGAAPAITDTIGGQTQISFPGLFSAVPYAKSGKLNAIAVAGNKRSSTLPDVPTLKELGVNGVDVSQWYGIFAPAKTPKAVITQLNTALNKVLQDKDVIKKIEDQGGDVEGSTPEELKRIVASELIKWKRVVQQAKITAE
jgi:tripartite-type tricarboxylate transporter receptor subunit TctC